MTVGSALAGDAPLAGCPHTGPHITSGRVPGGHSTPAAPAVRIPGVELELGVRVHVSDVETLHDVADLTAPAPVEPGDVLATPSELYQVETVLLDADGLPVRSRPRPQDRPHDRPSLGLATASEADWSPRLGEALAPQRAAAAEAFDTVPPGRSFRTHLPGRASRGGRSCRGGPRAPSRSSDAELRLIRPVELRSVPDCKPAVGRKERP